LKLELIGKPIGCKLLRMSIDIDESLDPRAIIRSISIRGDFFAIPEESFDELQYEIRGTMLGDLGKTFAAIATEKGLQCAGIDGEGLATLVNEALIKRI